MTVSRNDDHRILKAMWEEANRIIIDATYSGRSHQAMGVRWQKINHWVGLPTTVVSALASAAAGISAIAEGEVWITASLALGAAALTSVHSFLKADQVANAHGIKGDRLISLKGDTVRFQQVDLASDLSVEVLQRRLSSLAERRNALRETEPRHIPRDIYERTKKSIEAGESDYENDHLWLESPY